MGQIKSWVHQGYWRRSYKSGSAATEITLLRGVSMSKTGTQVTHTQINLGVTNVFSNVTSETNKQFASRAASGCGPRISFFK
jgi:hypothetical protein